jgi:hypothetical protein
MQELHELRRLNFDKLLILKHPDVKNYSYREYKENNHQHPQIVGYCTQCEKEKCNRSVTDAAEFSLRHISHGAHSQDFLDALKVSEDVTNWHGESVLFVYETASLDDENRRTYKPVEFSGEKKYPTHEWYWVHHDRKAQRFPEGFKGRSYSDFFLSAILTFRLRNAYMTNLVKCGLNSEDGKRFQGLADFNPKCIETCVAQYLTREIEILQPRVIFAMGCRSVPVGGRCCEGCLSNPPTTTPGGRTARIQGFVFSCGVLLARTARVAQGWGHSASRGRETSTFVHSRLPRRLGR